MTQRAVPVLVLAVAAMGCGPRQQGPRAARHLVLVTIDTLRADRLGCYGARDVATPRLDRLAEEGAMAPEAIVHVPLTRPSHTSLLTGLHPAEHGLRDNVSPALRADVPTLASILKDAGFRTAAVVSSIVLSAQSGLNRGFETYSDRFEAGGDDARFLNSLQRRGDGPTAEAIAWLESQREGRLFLWLHLYDPHDPYEPPEPYLGRYAGRPYDGEVAWSDELVGRLDDALARLGRTPDTLLIVTSDHGEGLGEHGESVHGFFLYQSTLRVPFLVRGPGVAAGARPDVTVRSVDVVPTVLEMLGVPRPGTLRLAGRSVAPALRSAAGLVEQASYAESLLPLVHYGWSDLRMLREGRWKYVQAPRPELYDLANDPGELRDLAAAEPQRVEALRGALSRLMAEEQAAAPSDAATVPADLLEKLGALGYLGAGGSSPTSTTGADPKDKIEEFKVLNRLVREGLIRLREKDHAGAEERLGELARRGIDSFEVHYYRARALSGLGRHRQAATEYAGAIRRLPGFAAAHLGLADARLALGDRNGALEAARAGAQASPNDPRLPERAGQILRKLKRPQEAVREYETAARLAPEDALLQVQLGEARRDAGDTAGAVAALRQAVQIDPEASYWNSLGMVLGAAGQLSEAEQAFREAVQRADRNAEYAYNLGLVLLRQGRVEDAAASFRRAADLDPGFPAPRQRLAELGRR